MSTKNVKNILIRHVWAGVSRFVPISWFSHPEDAMVWVSAYRVYRVPLDGTFERHPLVADFELVRAVFVHWDAPYFNLNYRLLDQGDENYALDIDELDWSSTGNGVLLLLITPLSEAEHSDAEVAARERVGLVRSVIVALMGRNAAFEHEFEIQLHLGTRTVGAPSPAFESPAALDVPAVDKEGVGLVEDALKRMSGLENLMQERIRLALRWYQRSFGDDRLVRDPREGDVDDFINSWLAWETLAREGNTTSGSIRRMLADIHGLEVQRTGELFPIGRIESLRGDILHQGKIDSLKPGLTRFMGNVFVDLLLHTLGLASGQNTATYLDGSANELV